MIMMDIFQQRYYKINKFLLELIGQWPFQSRARRYTAFLGFVLLATTQIIPQIIAVVEFSDDMEVILDSIPPFVIDFACGSKLANIVINSDKMLKIMKRIESDWATVSRQPEIYIIREYAEVGRKFTLAYAVGVYMTTVLFMTQPLLPRILEFFSPVNESQPLKFPFPVDYYGIDFESNYYYMLMHSVVCVASIVTVVIAADTLFIVQIQHACGMFAVIGHQMKRMADDASENYEQHRRPMDDPAFRYMRICIKRHTAIIELSELLEESYTWAFFNFIGLNMIMMSITGYQTVTRIDEKPEEALRYAVFTMAQIVHLFFQSFFSQRLKDHSEEIREYMCQAEWYKTPLCTQKLITLVTMRTNVPCQLTAGKILPMSLETFTSVMKTSVSYFTLLRSMS